MNDTANQLRRRQSWVTPCVAATLLAILLASDRALIHWHTMVNWPWWCNALEHFGSAWCNILLPPAALLVALIINHRALRQLIIALPLQMIVVHTLKMLAGRVRPIHGADPLLFSPFSSVHESFPSGHSAMVWTVAFTFALQRSRSTAIWFCIAAYVCWARLHTYAHFPSDLLAGVMVGWIVAFTTGTILKPWIDAGTWEAWHRPARFPWRLTGLWLAALLVPITVAIALGRRVVSVDEPAAREQIAVLYREVLDRQADAPGLTAYAKQRLDGQPLIAIERDLLDSDESRRRLKAMDPPQRVRWLHQLLASREPTDAEIARDQPLVEDLSRQRGRLGLLVMRLTWPRP